jgi:hypothetical protein
MTLLFENSTFPTLFVEAVTMALLLGGGVYTQFLTDDSGLFNDADGGAFTAMTRLVLLDSDCFFCDEDADFIGGSTLLHLISIPLGDDTVVLAVFELFVVVGGGATTDGS